MATNLKDKSAKSAYTHLCSWHWHSTKDCNYGTSDFNRFICGDLAIHHVKHDEILFRNTGV